MLAQKIVEVASSQVGVKESRPNGGEMIEKYQGATWLPIGQWAWCAAFVCWCIREAMRGGSYSFDRPMTAGAWDFESWCKSIDRSALLKKPHNGVIKSGDIVIFTFSHIGIAVSDIDKNGIVQTIEGNTNSDGEREGDGVYRKRRHESKIRSIIRFTV